MKIPYARIHKDCPRRNFWLLVYHSDCVPIETDVPHLASFPAPGPEVAHCYRVRTSALTRDQRRRFLTYMAGTGSSQAEVERLLDDPEHGLPILAQDVTVYYLDEKVLN